MSVAEIEMVKYLATILLFGLILLFCIPFPDDQ